jgi:hypothetical protein
MCDALSRNVPKLSEGVEILLALCMAHYLESGVIQSEGERGLYRAVNRSRVS